jgi:hypothetical protein
MKKGRFSKIVVIFCIVEITFVQLWSMRIASHNSFSTADILLANHSVFGGELLLLCLKRILTDPNKCSTKNTCNTNGAPDDPERGSL